MFDSTEAVGLAKAVGRLTVALANVEAERDEAVGKLRIAEQQLKEGDSDDGQTTA